MSASETRCELNVFVVMRSEPASRKRRCILVTISGQVRASRSFVPRTSPSKSLNLSPRNSSSVSLYCWMVVPVAPSRTNILSFATASIDGLPRVAALRGRAFILSSAAEAALASPLSILSMMAITSSSVVMVLLIRIVLSAASGSSALSWYSSTIRNAFSTSSSLWKSISICTPSPPILSSNGRSSSRVTQHAMMLFPPARIFL